MNRTQVQCLAVLVAFFIIDFGPISPVCLIGLYAVIARPRWLLRLVRAVYRRAGHLPSPVPPLRPGEATPTRVRCFLGLLGLFLLDVVPIPVTSSVALFILLTRPAWFYRKVEAIYADRAA
ncbi:hypothetical protein SAMN02949497_1131 [Methylomagnum ishizawai]|uniref:Uncharacterized protein n=1 Tax=Methylomagnum ishizawai TaxID=1760988 RepID=A0A1Y6CT69_9GAMM|nr:hypothetical protein [Methylomagnum ishizawai]SMF93839.1 hypothetical protein SAMN02949497_1131 [Methylomagnum ishizawai]